MNRFNRNFASVGCLLIGFAWMALPCLAADTKIQGMIKSRSGATMIVQSPDSSGVEVVLTDKTQVGQIEGVLKVRRKEMSMAALIPGLEVQVEGDYNEHRQLIATVVKFQGNDLERAQSIQAGMHETQAKAASNKEELEKQNERLAKQNEELARQHEKLEGHEQKIAANKAAVDAAVARFGQLDEYYIFDEATVYFGNGKVKVDPQYKPQLKKLAEGAKKVEGYMIQVIGYASSSGSAELNQKLSEDRAGSVTNVLTQDCHVPLTNVLAPGAMGESRLVGDEKTEEGQAQNRRVVVRVLQNKGIAGRQATQ
jgi:outer membrane protein OmpA-like peptidoglycan-associated protein